MIFMNVEVGHGFLSYDDLGSKFYGLIVGVQNGLIDYIRVDRIYDEGRDRIRCYDDGDAIKEQDEHHVRLDSCPPPFSAFGSFKNWKGETRSNVVAFVDMLNMQFFPLDLFENGACKIIDNGAKVSEKDMNVVYNHPWVSRMHREFLKKDFTELNKDETAKHVFGVYGGRRLPDISDIESCTDNFGFGG